MSSAPWGYGSNNGPSTWAKHFLDARGTRQSPIDLQEDDCVADETLNTLAWQYPSDSLCKYVTNTGHGWKVHIDEEETAVLRGGPLKHDYKLAQFHMHWGTTCSDGSEHTVNGKPYAAELHFVHWNNSKYDTFQEACQWEDGLAVLGVFCTVAPSTNQELCKIINLLDQVPYQGQQTDVLDSLDINELFPKNKTYWTYSGSLTTPPCTETVTWVVFQEPIEISEEQLEACRCLRRISSEDEKVDGNNVDDGVSNSLVELDEFENFIRTNYRPVQEKGNRVVRQCVVGK